MSILSVNLKHLYQRRELWVVYLLFGFVVFFFMKDSLVHPKAGEGDYIRFAKLAFFIGCLLTLHQMEVLSKPLSYCLPGHRRVFRRYVFCTAIATSGVCSMLFLRYPDLYGGQLLLVVCSAFFAGLTFYTAGVLPAMAGGVPAMLSMNAVVLLFLWARIGCGKHYNLDVLLERIIIGNGYLVIFVGVLSSIGMWLWLGRQGLARRYCAGAWTSLSDVFNMEKLKRYGKAPAGTRQKLFRKHPRAWVENWFLERMNKYDYRGPGRFFWGALYSTSSTAVSVWRWLLVLTLLLTIMCGYAGQTAMFILILLYANNARDRQPLVYSTMLISGGRHRRYTTSLALAVTDAASFCIGSLVISGLSIPLARFMPTFAIEGMTFSFGPIDPRVAIVPWLFLPFVSTMRLIFRRMPFILLGSLYLPMSLGMYLGIVWRERVEPLVNPLSVVSLLFVSWGVFLLTLRHICSKWSLVGGR